MTAAIKVHRRDGADGTPVRACVFPRCNALAARVYWVMPPPQKWPYNPLFSSGYYSLCERHADVLAADGPTR